MSGTITDEMTFQTKRYPQPFLFAACLLLLAAVCSAQQPFQYKYTLDNGLPYVESNDVNFTSDGELWVSYTNGEILSRFDGLNWTHYPLAQLRLPLRLYFLAENAHGIWFQDRSSASLTLACLTKTGQWKTYRFEGDYITWPDIWTGEVRCLDPRFFPYHFDPEADEFVKSESPVYSPKDKEFEKNNGVWSTLNGASTLVVIRPTDNRTTLQYGEKFAKSIDLPHPSFYPIYVGEQDVRGLVVKEGKLYWYAQRQSRPLDILLPSGRKGEYVDRVYLRHWDFHANNNALSGVVVKDPSDDTFYLYRLDSLGQSILLSSHLHGDYYAGAFAEDKYGNWWYGTSTGLVRTNPAFKTFNQSNPAMVSGLHAIGEDEDGNIWLGGYNGLGGFAVFDGKKLHRRTFSRDAMGILPGSLRSKAGTLYFFNQNSQGLVAIKNGRFRDIHIPDHEYLHGYYFLLLSNGKIGLGLQGKGIGMAEETDGLISSVRTIGKEKGLLLDNLITIAEDRAGRIWAGRSSQGIAIYDPQLDTAVTWLRSPELPGSIGAMSSCVDENGALWLGAHNGLYRLERPHEFDYFKNDLTDFIQKIALPGRDTTTVSFLQNTADYIVAGSQLGVYFFDKNYHGERPRIFSLKYGPDLEGGGSEQNAVLLDSKGFLWIGTQTGATRIELSQLHWDTSATTLKLTAFQAGDSPIPIEKLDLGSLPYGKRNMRFSFAPSGNDRLRDNLFFDIFLVKSDGDTLFQRISTREKTNLQIDHLPYGDYALHLVAYKHNVLSGHAEYHFTVPKFLNENPWFWVALTTALMGVLFTYVYIRKRHQLELEKSKRERDGLKVQALSNFFNPHFINNSLHWVQGKYRKDPETATMIGRLADNVFILYKNTQSGVAYHSLEQELHIVTNYLKIQQVRFGGGLDANYDFQKEPGRYDGVYVPAMLLQIHTENAVEKGIRNRKGASQITLSVRLEPEGCHIVIEDDGRGRPLTQEDRIVERKGSTEVMDDLVRLFNQYNAVPLTIKYEDRIFKDTDGSGYGTRVLIFIPKNFNYEL